jgi:hypothetical protein
VRLAAGFVVPLAEKVSAICFDDPRPTNARARLHADLDGKAVSRRLLSTALPRAQGGRRQVLLVGLPAAILAESRVDLALGREPVAAIDPEWLESPLTEAAALTDGLSGEGQRRLLALLVTTGASLFGAEASAGFAAIVDRLFQLLGLRALAPDSWCPIGASGRLITFRTESAIDPERIGPLTALVAGRFTRLPACQAASERSNAGSLLHVHVPHLPAGATMIASGEVPLQLRMPDEKTPGRPPAPWLPRRAAATQAWVHGLLDEAARTDPVAAAQLAEIGLGEEAAPRIAIRHLSATSTGLLYAAALEDRHGLVRALRIERDGAVADIPIGPSPRSTRNLAGFVAMERPARFGTDRTRFRLVYGSGRIRTAAEATAEPYRGQVSADFDLSDQAAVAALAEARMSIHRPDRTVDCLGFGPQPSQPALSLISPIGADLDIVSARAAMLFREPGAGDVELLYHVEAGPLADAACVAADRAAAVYGVAHRIIMVAPGGDRSDRLLAALARARGAAMLLLGAAVLPAASGWLTTWRCRLVETRPMLGGTLIDVAGAIIDAGGRSIEERRFVGLPEDDLPAVPALVTARATCDCVGMTRDVAHWLLTDATRYPNPDVMVAAAAAELAANGREVATLLRSRFVRYAEPSGDHRTECIDIEAMRRLLKRSFSSSGHGIAP